MSSLPATTSPPTTPGKTGGPRRRAGVASRVRRGERSGRFRQRQPALGINAHVQRDLPFVLYGIGLVTPEGTSRKSDHDRVNQILNRVTDDVIAEIARRFDPTIDDGNAPTTLDDFVLFQSIVSWRETAWRHAELLAQAPTPEARERVAQDIENYASSQASAIRRATQYLPLSGGSTARDAYCAIHWAD